MPPPIPGVADPVVSLNQACEAFDKNDFGTRLVAMRTLLNDLQTWYNAHAHSGTAQPPSTSVSAASASAFPDTFALDRSYPAMAEVAGFWSDLTTLANELKLRGNAHTHTAIGTLTGSSFQISAPAVAIPDLGVCERLDRTVPALGFRNETISGVGSWIRTMGTLVNELRSDFIAHTHVTSMTKVVTSSAVLSASAIATLR